MTGDLAVWLRAQLDADEQTARKAASAPTPWYTPQDWRLLRAFAAEHIARHDPAFTLADITAKRAIIDLHDSHGGWGHECATTRRDADGRVRLNEDYYGADSPCPTLRLLAQPYAGRPGWHNEWTTT